MGGLRMSPFHAGFISHYSLALPQIINLGNWVFSCEPGFAACLCLPGSYLSFILNAWHHLSYCILNELMISFWICWQSILCLLGWVQNNIFEDVFLWTMVQNVPYAELLEFYETLVWDMMLLCKWPLSLLKFSKR